MTTINRETAMHRPGGRSADMGPAADRRNLDFVTGQAIRRDLANLARLRAQLAAGPAARARVILNAGIAGAADRVRQANLAREAHGLKPIGP